MPRRLAGGAREERLVLLNWQFAWLESFTGERNQRYLTPAVSGTVTVFYV
jgi:hypothetical protein